VLHDSYREKADPSKKYRYKKSHPKVALPVAGSSPDSYREKAVRQLADMNPAL